MNNSTLQHYTPSIDAEAINRALMAGDISKLQPADRVQFYLALCQSCGLNVLTRPFILLKTQSGELTWYATVGAAEQLRKLHHVSTRILSRERTEEGLYIVTVQVFTPDGRQEESQGIEFIGGSKGQALGNAMMKAASKSLRRATLAICGLGLALDGDERGVVVPFNPQTGDVTLPPEPLDDAPGQAQEEAATLLTTVGKWFRQRPPHAWETIAQAVWDCALREIPHLSQEALAAGWRVLDAGQARFDWESRHTLAEDLRAWREAHAREAILDVFDRDDGSPDASV